jgi:ribosome maturation factor RimP
MRLSNAALLELVAKLAAPSIEEAGCVLWDVEFVKEGGERYLRVYIDNDEGVSIDQCELVSRALDKALDEADPIDESYILEVSSAGAERRCAAPRTSRSSSARRWPSSSTAPKTAARSTSASSRAIMKATSS